MTYTFDEKIVSDLHKDARGFRPSEAWWEQWILSSDQWKQRIWDDLCKEVEESIARERLMAEESVKDFESDLNLHIALGAGDRETALR